jgi:hypothetical protein
VNALKNEHMKKLNLIRMFFVALTFGFLFLSCEKKIDYTDIDFWATGWTTDEQLEFYVDGIRVQPKYPEIVQEHRPGNLFEASSGGKESVTIDFWITYNNTVYTSIPERTVGPVSPSFTLNGDETVGGTQYNITPTGNFDNPWSISKENDDSDPCFVGKWVQNISDCNALGAEKIFNFNSNGTGYISNVIIDGYYDNCTILCTVRFNITWEDLGGGSVYITYTSIENDCGQNPVVPGPETISIVCNGSSINMSGQIYQKQ